MKKTIFLALLLISCTAMSYGQNAVQSYSVTARTQLGAVKTTVDTTTDTDTTYLYPSFNSGENKEFGDVQYCWVVVPSITGTTTGTVIVQGSETGTFVRYQGAGSVSDWVALTSSTAEYNGSSSISISGTAPIYGYFCLPNNQFKFTRIRYVTSGTQTSYIKTTNPGKGVNLRKHGG